MFIQSLFIRIFIFYDILIARLPGPDWLIFILEFVCEDSFGVACPAGVDKDLWSRFQAFEKWNASH